MTHQQRIIWPWETRDWPTTKSKFTEKMNSIVDMDTRVSTMHRGRVKPRQITELFNAYYSSDQKDKVSKEHFINDILPMMQKFVETAPKTFRGFNSVVLFDNIALNRLQVATVITCMWFGLLEYDYLSGGKLLLEEFPEPTFTKVFNSQNLFALSCLLNYFNRVYEYMYTDDDTKNTFTAGNIIIKRNVLKPIDWSTNTKPINEIFVGEGNVDDSSAKLHTVYAHEFIGGNMFKEGLTPEETLLLIRPECLIMTLFCKRMEVNEAYVLMGAEKMSQYKGYGSSVTFAGDYRDTSPRGYSVDETEVMLQHAAIFIDATPKTAGHSQYVHEFDRDLNKAYCGYSALEFKNQTQVSSGNWTYGFNGSAMQVKFIQQVLAASAANKCLAYHAFGRDFEDKIIPFIDWIQRNKKTVADIYNAYKQLITESYSGPHSRLADLDIFECLMEA